MRNKNTKPQLNAGSMADIAFLLLIFFLVSTTIPNDKGIARMLPRPCKTKDCDTKINERNILKVSVNNKGELFINEKKTQMNDLRSLFKDFIDNNGDASCTYCIGNGLANASDNPKEASIFLDFNRNTPYKYYIQVQNELTASYNELRETYSERMFQKKIKQLSKDEFSKVKEAYPFRISEANVK